MTSHTTFIRKQSNEYQQTTIKLKDLETTLEHQQIIQSNRIIPKQYQCKLLKSFDTSITERFNQEHSNLFFQQLDCAITSNSINVELLITSIVVRSHTYSSTTSQTWQQQDHNCISYHSSTKKRKAKKEVQCESPTTKEK